MRKKKNNLILLYSSVDPEARFQLNGTVTPIIKAMTANNTTQQIIIRIFFWNERRKKRKLINNIEISVQMQYLY